MKLISSLQIRTLLAVLFIATICSGMFASARTPEDLVISTPAEQPEQSHVMRDGIRVWPTRVSSILNVGNLTGGESVTIYTQDGEVARRGTSGNDGFIQFDLSDFEAGEYIVSAGEHNVKIVKL